MNTCNLSGRLSKPGTVRGSDPKVLSFVLETKYGGNESQERTTLVPCALFNPTAKLEQLLTNPQDDLWIELQGRVQMHSLDVNGETFRSTEVIVFNKTLTVVRS